MFFLLYFFICIQSAFAEDPINTAQKHLRHAETWYRVARASENSLDAYKNSEAEYQKAKKALEKANWEIKDLDLVESNEAFAAQSLAVIKDLKIPKEIVNVNGGAIALGHPIGASGARVIVTLIHELKRQKKQKGIATLCIGGGQGIAMCIEAYK